MNFGESKGKRESRGYKRVGGRTEKGIILFDKNIFDSNIPIIPYTIRYY